MGWIDKTTPPTGIGLFTAARSSSSVMSDGSELKALPMFERNPRTTCTTFIFTTERGRHINLLFCEVFKVLVAVTTFKNTYFNRWSSEFKFGVTFWSMLTGWVFRDFWEKLLCCPCLVVKLTCSHEGLHASIGEVNSPSWAFLKTDFSSLSSCKVGIFTVRGFLFDSS